MKWVRCLLLFFIFSSYAYAGARTDADERLITSVCQSKAPVLVVDNFANNPTNVRDIDLNGDGSYDVFHGDFVTKVIEYDGHSILKAVIGTPVYPADLLRALQPYLAKIKSGELKISRINFSQGFPVNIDSLNQLLGLNSQINAQNVYLYGDRVLKAIWTLHPELQLQQLYAVFQQFQKLGVPIFIAAGNSGFKDVNLYSLFPDVHSVGALNLKDKKASYSADNSTVTIWRPGGILTYAVNGGIAIGNHEKPDFNLPTPAVPQVILNNLNGKTPDGLVSQIPAKIEATNNDDTATFSELTAKLPKGLYDTRSVLRRTLGTVYTQAGYIESLGDYFYLDGVHTSPLFFVHVDAFSDKILIQQGIQSTDGRQFRNVIYGTSFAAPGICDGQRTPEKYAL